MSKDKWEVTTERFIAFIDIMGFKDLVARTPHSELYKIMKEVVEKKNLNENIFWGGIDSKLVATITFSDSIMIYSRDSSSESCRSLISTVSGLTYDLLCASIPFKGGVAFGTLTLDTENSIYFGQPLIDAYLLQEELFYYGVIIHGSAEKEIKDRSLNPPFIEEYACPFKSGFSKHLVIPPMYVSLANPKYSDSAKELYEGLEKLRYRTSGSLRKYIDNTEACLKFLCEID